MCVVRRFSERRIAAAQNQNPAALIQLRYGSQRGRLT